MKRLITSLVLSAALVAGSNVATNQPADTAHVWVTKAGKRYHSSKECWALRNSKAMSETTEASAKAAGLAPCGICYRAEKASKKGDK